MTPEQEIAVRRARERLASGKTVKTTSEPGEPNAAGGGGLTPFTPEQQAVLTRARERVANENDPSIGSRADKYIRASARGLGEGVAATAQLPGQGVDYLIKKGKSIITGQPREPVGEPLTDLYNENVPPPPAGYETTNDVSSILGPAIIETAATFGAGGPAAFTAAEARAAARATARGAGARAAEAAGRSAGNLGSLKRLSMVPVKAAGNTALGIGGGMAGSYLGEEAGNLLGDPETGREIGGFIGGVGGPVAVGRAGRAGARALLTDADSASRLRAADQLGIEPSMGLVGNKQAAGMEDYTAGIALGGGPAYSMRRQQYEDMDAAAQRIAENMRGGPAGGRISEGSVGSDVRRAAETADASIGAAKTNLWEPFMDAVGRETVVPDIPLLDQMRMARSNAPGTSGAQIGADLKPILDDRMAALEHDRIRTVDPAEATAIEQRQAQVDRWETAMRNAASQGTPVTPGQLNVLDRMQTRIQQERALLARRADENTGTNFTQLKDWRSNLGKSIDANSGGLPTKVQDPLYATTTEAMRSTAERQGVPRSEFDRVMDESTRLSGQGDLISPLVDQTNEGRGYNQMFSSTNEQGTGLPAALAEHAPGDLGRALANNFELQTRGNSAGAPTVNPETVNPRGIQDFWESLPEQNRQLYGQNSDADALATVAAADARRPTRTLPGKGGNTLGGPLTTFTLPALAAGAGVGAAGGPGMLLAALPTIMARAYGGMSTSPGITRGIVNPATGLLDGSRLAPALASLNAFLQQQQGVR